MSDSPRLNCDEIRNKLAFEYPLTDQQIWFSYHYAKTGNGMASIRMAGYNHSTPGSQSSAAYRLLNIPRIKKVIGMFKNGELGSDRSN